MTFLTDTAPQFGHPLQTFAEALARYRKNRVRRKKFKNLLDLNDQMLSDIGVHRGEVELAANLPLSVNAATELQRMSLERKRRFM